MDWWYGAWYTLTPGLSLGFKSPNSLVLWGNSINKWQFCLYSVANMENWAYSDITGVIGYSCMMCCWFTGELSLCFFQMIKDCMKKVITVNLHQTVKVQCLWYIMVLAPFVPLKSTAFNHPIKSCSRNVGLLTWVNSGSAHKSSKLNFCDTYSTLLVRIPYYAPKQKQAAYIKQLSFLHRSFLANRSKQASLPKIVSILQKNENCPKKCTKALNRPLSIY